MSRLGLLVQWGVLLWPGLTRAEPAVAVAASGTGNAFVDREIRGRELDDWRDPRLGIAGTLVAGCGTSIEVRLSGTGTINYLDLTLSNQNEFPVWIADRQVIALFANGRGRYLELEGLGTEEVASGWWTHATFRFPDKADFAGQDALRVNLPLLATGKPPCVLSVDVRRSEGAPRRRRTSTAFSQLQVDFGLGAHFAAAGALHDIARTPELGFELGMIGFPWINHGFSLDFGLDRFGGDGVEQVLPSEPSASGLNGLFLMTGYVFRLLPTRRLSLTYAPSLGAYHLYVVRAGDAGGQATSSTSLGFRQRLRLSVLVGTVRGSRFELGPAIQHSYLPFGTLGEANVSGSLFSGSLFLTLGE